MIWAAVSAPPAAGESATVLRRERVSLALSWIIHFSERRLVSLPRAFCVDERPLEFIIGFDASTTGGGAWFSRDGGKHYHGFYYTVWDATDEIATGALKEDPGSQPLWEAYALLLAITTWATFIKDAEGQLGLRGDASGVLQSVVRRKARHPLLNAIVIEAQLELGVGMSDLTAAHYWSEDNGVADDLSRVGEGSAIPQVLQGIVPSRPVRRQPWAFLGGGRPGGLAQGHRRQHGRAGEGEERAVRAAPGAGTRSV